MRNTRNAYQDDISMAYREAIIRAIDKMINLDVRGLEEVISVIVSVIKMLMVIHEIIYSCGS